MSPGNEFAVGFYKFPTVFKKKTQAETIIMNEKVANKRFDLRMNGGDDLLYLGTSKVDITPARPVPLAGFAVRSNKGPYEGVSHPLHARILLFQHVDEQGRKTSLALVSADLLWWGSDRVPELKKRIRARWAADEIILTSTHTHSGPQTSTLFAPSLGKPEMDYIVLLEDRLLKGVSAAAGRLEPVAVEWGKGSCSIGIYRRTRNGDVIDFGPNPNGPVDHDLNVIRFTAENHRVKAILVHYACHPVTTTDNFVSSEFTGFAMDRLEQSLGEETVAAFLQGTCGDINPSVHGQFCTGGDAEVTRLGHILADDVQRALENMETLQSKALASKTVHLNIPLRRIPERSVLEATVSDPGVRGEWSRLLLASPERMREYIPMEMTKVTLAEGLMLLTFNAEVVVEYGLFAKGLVKDGVLPMGYCNGMIGYVPTARQLDEGGYEAVESTYYFGLPAPIHPSAEKLFRRAISRILLENDDPVSN